MKIVRFRGFELIFLFALAVISHAEWNLRTPCAVSEENSLFVNSTSGQNIPSCGLKENPACLTISYAIKMAVQRNFPSVLINISTGSYNELDSIKLDCSRWNLKKIVLWGERQDKQVVQVSLSLDVQFCEMSLINVHWTSGHSVLHNVLLSNLSICECIVQETDFSVIGSSSNIVLQDSSISNSSGYQQELPLISVTSLPEHQNMLQIINCNFSHNVGPLILVSSIYQAFIMNSHVEGSKAFSGDQKMITSQFSHLSIFTTRFVDNFGTLVEVQNSGSLNASDCHFNQNQVFAGSILQLQGMTRAGFKDCVFQDSSSSSEGPVIRIIDNYSSASFEHCHFSCNMVNGSVFVPPVFSHDIRQMSCDNCSVDHNCPVHCSPGQFVSHGIFCKSCPVGSYSPGVTGNKTVMQCASCPPGTYGSKTKSVNCTPCAKDTFSSKAGSTSCTKCKNDFFTSKPGQATCSRLTVEFITLVVVTSLLIVIPLLILLLQSKRSAHKGDAYFLVRSDDASPLLRKNNNSNHSIQNNDAEDSSSLSDLLS